MTYSESFTQAKDKENPDSNEDRLVAVTDRLYAVIDGATDKSGRTYDGLTGGQIAGRILEDVLRNVARDLSQGLGAPETSAILGRVNGRLRKKYRGLGIAGLIRRDPWRRFSAQATIAIRHESSYRFIVVGDTGLRLNRREVFSGPKPVDIICAQGRAAVHRHLSERGAEPKALNEWSRAYTVEGLAAVLPAAGIGSAELGAIRIEARRQSLKRLPGMAAEDIDGVLARGLKGLHRYRNRPGRLGFPSIDGSRVPPDMIIEFERPAESIECMELFSDGYPGVAPGATVADWEASFRKVERDDAERVSAHPETKGSAAGRFADDRTVLIVRPQAGCES